MIPLVEVIKLLNGSNKPQVGFIYDTLDQAKETIKKEFKHQTSHYASFWEAIDDIWDEYLHSHLHVAGYFLNPTIFYSRDFHTNVEGSRGLCFCVICMAEHRHKQDLITSQIDEYHLGKLWLQNFGGQNTEVIVPNCIGLLFESLVTCNGASHYRLKRSLVEILLTERMNRIGQQRPQDLLFIHCNMQVQALDPEGSHDIAGDVLDLMDEWTVGKRPNLVSGEH
ncbi:uncharacterized protein LOC132601898 [Lycium barbarum]|uniref:uncharacterized protein LOC132601898 n=1 Tax=Lycium barbarum TaxID=112863 RepID=UPI00293F0707|nr:uncharacterized protein LOC132601898 [Lycium barbarum]